ncbi:hypothetical protein AAULH_13956, partial [Lactobacillus helveticus MTCC 5463]
MLNKRAKGTAIKNMFSISHMKNDLVWAFTPHFQSKVESL